MRAASVLVFWLIGTLAAYGASFDSANELYDAGKFSEAREEYRQLIGEGKLSANVFHNLGNAEYRLGNAGAAILQYERAIELDPAQPEARANLTLVRGQTGARVWAGSWIDSLFPQWRVDVFAVMAAASGWIGIFALAALVRRREKAATLIGATIAIVVACYAAMGIWRADQRRELAIITQTEAEARLAPAESAGIAEALPPGSQVRILSERGDWAYCDLPDSKTRGWINLKALERVRMGAS